MTGDGPAGPVDFLAAVPGLSTLLEGLIESIAFPSDYPVRFLDLGAGRGALSELLLDKFPNSTANLMETRPDWLGEARERLQRFGDRVALRGDDFAVDDLRREQDLVVAAFQLSGLDDIRRRGVYRAIYGALRPDGLCRFVDRFRGPTQILEQLYAKSWADAVAADAAMPADTVAAAEEAYAQTRGMWIGNEITWLDSISFRDVDIFCKDAGFAVVGCRKPVAADFDSSFRAIGADDEAEADG